MTEYELLFYSKYQKLQMIIHEIKNATATKFYHKWWSNIETEIVLISNTQFVQIK